MIFWSAPRCLAWPVRFLLQTADIPEMWKRQERFKNAIESADDWIVRKKASANLPRNVSWPTVASAIKTKKIWTGARKTKQSFRKTLGGQLLLPRASGNLECPLIWTARHPPYSPHAYGPCFQLSLQLVKHEKGMNGVDRIDESSHKSLWSNRKQLYHNRHWWNSTEKRWNSIEK